MTDKVACRPATAGRWKDLETVFEDCSYARKCWCAYWYLPNRDFKAGWGDGNRRSLAKLVRQGKEPGVLAYRDGMPVGWCGVAPRDVFDRLRRSEMLAPIDKRRVWSINCFVVRKQHRRAGLMRLLIRGAVRFAKARGARTIEAYPVDPRPGIGSSELYTGTLSAFLDEGFVEVERRRPHRPILRLAP